MNKTIQKIKGINGSVIFLISTIATLLCAVFLVLCGAEVDGLAKELWKAINAETAAGSGIGANVESAFSILPIAVIVNGALAFFTALGMWLFYKANKSSSDSVSNLGLTIIKAVKLVEVVVFTFIYLIVGFVVATIIWAVFAVRAETETLLYVEAAVAAAVYITVYILVVTYYRSIFKTIHSIKMTLATGVIMGKVSRFLIVSNMVLVLYWAIMAVFSPFVFGLISAALHGVAFLFVALYLINLRKEMHHIASRGGETK